MRGAMMRPHMDGARPLMSFHMDQRFPLPPQNMGPMRPRMDFHGGPGPRGGDFRGPRPLMNGGPMNGEPRMRPPNRFGDVNKPRPFMLPSAELPIRKPIAPAATNNAQSPAPSILGTVPGQKASTVPETNKPRPFMLSPAVAPVKKLMTPKSTEKPASALSEAANKKSKIEDVSAEFFEKIRSHGGNTEAISSFVLQSSQKEFLESKGEKKHLYKPGGVGNFSCALCQLRFIHTARLDEHMNSAAHKELEELCKHRTEQARLIGIGEISHPLKGHPDHTASVLKAATEMKLEPQKCTLDEFILGIYESVMKPYWPLPSSRFYCRMCNYVEFKTSEEFERHTAQREHKKREDSYKEAFCLYCQVHNTDKNQMAVHEKSDKHKKICALMEDTKQAAIEHWHQTCNLDLPAKYKQAQSGSKRTATSSESPSPAKKPTPATATKSPASTTAPARMSAGKQMKPRSSTTTSTTTSTTPAVTSAEQKSLWFVPVKGFMCAACQTYVGNESLFESHANEKSHKDCVEKFKRILAS